MQAKAIRYGALGAAIAAVCVWMVLAAGRRQGDEGLYSIQNPAQYNAGLTTVRELTGGPIRAHDAGRALSGEQTMALEEAREVARRLTAYEPRAFGPAFLLANIEQALGNADEAGRNYHQALLLIPKDTGDQNLRQTEAHIQFKLGQHYYNRNEFSKAEMYADAALALQHNSSLYHTAAARIKMRLDKRAEARRLVEHALEIDPEDAAAKELSERLDGG
ncbi:MAG: hypothetical protein IIC73_05890 [Armatimonadetes bacterium]|nr:hypothetical protein [Armatimonadota bacterium]